MKTQRYSKQGLWSLFLTCAFPFHFWTLILAFRDISWVTERTNSWDAIGVISYGMLFALVESILLFLVVTLLGLITPKRWSVNKRIALLSLLFLITALWAMIAQLLFLWNINFPISILRFIAHTAHPLRVLYASSFVIVLPTVLLPAYSFLRSDKLLLFIQDLTDRFSTLTMLYLFFDLIGLVLVILRNIG
jgi:hypothetical protein